MVSISRVSSSASYLLGALLRLSRPRIRLVRSPSGSKFSFQSAGSSVFLSAFLPSHFLIFFPSSRPYCLLLSPLCGSSLFFLLLTSGKKIMFVNGRKFVHYNMKHIIGILYGLSTETDDTLLRYFIIVKFISKSLQIIRNLI